MKLHIHTMWGESNWLDMPAPIFDNEDLGNIWYLTKTRTFLFQRRMICRIKQAIWVKQNAKSTFASSTASAYHWMKRNYENNQRFLRSQHCLTGADHLGQRIHTGGLLLWALAGRTKAPPWELWSGVSLTQGPGGRQQIIGSKAKGPLPISSPYARRLYNVDIWQERAALEGLVWVLKCLHFCQIQNLPSGKP